MATRFSSTQIDSQPIECKLWASSPPPPPPPLQHKPKSVFSKETTCLCVCVCVLCVLLEFHSHHLCALSRPIAMASSLTSSFLASQDLVSLNPCALRSPLTSHFAPKTATARLSGFKKTVKSPPKRSPPRKPPPRKAGISSRPLWFPGAKSPSWLDGSFVGDYGFDPLGLGKPPEYVQYDFDSLDQNLPKNLAGDVIGRSTESIAEIRATALQPYSEVFGLQRFRECELIHGRWAMLAVLGALAVEAFTGVTWQDAGKVELVDGAQYFGFKLPFSISALIWIEAIIIGYIEFQRNGELDPEKRLYPGGKFFDPLGLAADPERKEALKLAEIKHARLAMVAAFGFAVQAAATGKGPLNNWVTHLSDPLHTTIIDTFSTK